MRRQITEDPEREIVTIDGVQIEGHIVEARCQTCGSAQIYYDKYDAFFCPDCNIWLERVCGDYSCFYCRSRPNVPLCPEAEK